MKEKSRHLQQRQHYLKNRLKSNELRPDGVFIHIDWDNFKPNMSVFVPAIDTENLKMQMNLIAQDRNWRLESRERVENNCWGVRFWRMV